jgi:hypothetical protein
VQHVAAVHALDTQQTHGRLLGAAVRLGVLGQLAQLAVDDPSRGLHGHAEAVAGDELVAVAAHAEHDVGGREALGHQALQDGVGPWQRDGVAVDQAHAFVQHLVAFGRLGAAEDIPQALHGALALGLGDELAAFAHLIEAARVA